MGRAGRGGGVRGVADFMSVACQSVSERRCLAVFALAHSAAEERLIGAAVGWQMAALGRPGRPGVTPSGPLMTPRPGSDGSYRGQTRHYGDERGQVQ